MQRHLVRHRFVDHIRLAQTVPAGQLEHIQNLYGPLAALHLLARPLRHLIETSQPDSAAEHWHRHEFDGENAVGLRFRGRQREVSRPSRGGFHARADS